MHSNLCSLGADSNTAAVTTEQWLVRGYQTLTLRTFTPYSSGSDVATTNERWPPSGFLVGKAIRGQQEGVGKWEALAVNNYSNHDQMGISRFTSHSKDSSRSITAIAVSAFPMQGMNCASAMPASRARDVAVTWTRGNQSSSSGVEWLALFPTIGLTQRGSPQGPALKVGTKSHLCSPPPFTSLHALAGYVCTQPEALCKPTCSSLNMMYN